MSNKEIKFKHNNFLRDLKKLTGIDIPLRDEILTHTFGVKIINREIVELALYNCNLENLPESLGDLSSLKKLYLGKNKLKDLPDSIGNLESLEYLDLHNNQIRNLPKPINNLKSLKNIEIIDNPLEVLPDIVFKLRYNVKVEHAKFLWEMGGILDKALPEKKNKIFHQTFGFRAKNGFIEELGLYNCNLKALPDNIGNLKTLKKLYIGKNKLIDIPDSLGDLKLLKILDIHDNQLNNLPKSIDKLKSIERLDLQQNKLTNIPNSLIKLQSLEFLYLNDNEIEKLPESLKELKNLKRIDLRNNKLKKIPDWALELNYNLDPEQAIFLWELETILGRYLPKNPNINIDNIGLSIEENKILELALCNCNLKILPESIGNLKFLQTLYLGINNLETLPNSIGNLISLLRLDLHENRLLELPESIGNLTNLLRLDLHENRLLELPESIGNLKHLKRLDLSYNKLKSLPDSIESLNSLEIFYFHRNEISTLSNSVLELKYAVISDQAKILWELEKTLNIIIPKQDIINPESFCYQVKDKKIIALALYNCSLEHIPISIVNLKSLQSLYLGYNTISSIPDSIENLKSLKILDLHANNIDFIPESIENLRSLKQLRIDWKKFKNIPKSLLKFRYNIKSEEALFLWELEKIINRRLLEKENFDLDIIGYKIIENNISELCLNNCNIHDIPESIQNLRFLERIYLKDNKLDHIPESLCRLNSINYIDLSNNRIEEITESIGKMTNLKFLDLSHNEIDSIPNSMIYLETLQSLNLANNKIISLPESMGNIRMLQFLDLSNNKLTKVPSSIGTLKNLTFLNLVNNCLKELPESMGGLDSLQKLYFDKNLLEFLPKPLLRLIYLVKSEQAQFLLDLEKTTGKEISYREEIRWNSYGYKIANGNIIELCLYNQKLIAIPESIGNLIYLEKLYLNNNRLKSLPESISKLKSLTYLNLRKNNFEKIPPLLWKLKKLKDIELIKNPWNAESAKIIERDIKSILQYCREKDTINIFISHAVIEFEKYRIKYISEFLERKDEINHAFFCEDDLVGNIDDFMNEKIPLSHVILLIASKKSLYNSKDCTHEIELAKKLNKKIIPIKTPNLDWNDLNIYGLDRELGIEWKINDIDSLCEELYHYVLKFKMEFNLPDI